MLIGMGHTIAVLAIDPSSSRTGGAILGDKTRMSALAASDSAFIRPSPSAGSLGGVAARTREAMLLTEAAGHTVVIVETVGVGQSETAVADMVDTFVALMLPGAGDELQGIKKGLLERADIIAVNKADGSQKAAAERAAADLLSAVKILAATAPPDVLTLSAQSGDGLKALWDALAAHREALKRTGALDERRRRQGVTWMRDMVRLGLDAYVAQKVPDLKEIEAAVANGTLAPTAAANAILERLP
ncbi:MAG: methylmalonyl Co-A mutase-associated GTPase MeaB, partial [Pseudomonadota bacterium]